MDKEKIKETLAYIQTNFVENKNNQLIILGIIGLFVVLLSISILVFVSKFSKPPATEIPKLTITPIKTKPTPTPKPNLGKIISASWSINCQLVATTAEKKYYLRKFDNCKQPLRYIISPSGAYLVYLYQKNSSDIQMYLYSINHNIDAVFDQPLSGLLDFKFTTEDNLVLLIDQKQVVYYMIPYLFNSYPNNFNLTTNQFNDLDQKKVSLLLPSFSTSYVSIREDPGQISLLNKNNEIIYSLLIKDLNDKIIPAAKKNPRVNYDWRKRVIYWANNNIKSVSIDGDDEETHSIVCEGSVISPTDIIDRPIARSPDGKTLFFVLPSKAIASLDLIKDVCEVTGIEQTSYFHENMAVSPNGQYLAFVNKSLHIYDLNKKQDYEVITYSMDDSSNPLAITGPLLWSSDNKFICLSVSKIEGNFIEKNYRISNTELRRVYFNDMFQGKEQKLTDLTHVANRYACSPDGDKAIYVNGGTLYMFSMQNQQNRFFKTQSDIDLNFNIIWLKSGKIVSNRWIADQTMQFTDISLGVDFSIDESGKYAAYTGIDKKIAIYDLDKQRIYKMKNGKKIEGNVLIFN